MSAWMPLRFINEIRVLLNIYRHHRLPRKVLPIMPLLNPMTAAYSLTLQPLCGYAIQDDTLELYKDLDTLRPEDLMLVDSTNIGKVMKLITAGENRFLLLSVSGMTLQQIKCWSALLIHYTEILPIIYGKSGKQKAIEDSLITKL